jgi:hypothetical protein
MSESSSYGESPSNRTSRSTKYGESPSGESNYARKSSESTPKTGENKLTEVKQKLKEIESYVIRNLNQEEKTSFINLFRKTIVDNETEVMTFPNASFFIAKFENLETPIDEKLKEKIMHSLYNKQSEEKQNSSKLKYW